MNTVLIKNYGEIPFSEKEILRYCGVKEASVEIKALMRSCLEELSDIFTYKICYIDTELSLCGSVCNFGLFSVNSKSLAKNLSDCGGAIIFAATVGTKIDRLIAKYSRLSPSRAVMLDAIGTERIEALCNTFCEEISALYTTRPRFSPGYGDMPIQTQTDIFRLLDASKHVGIFLNESLIMSPSKSVTAIIGIKK